MEGTHFYHDQSRYDSCYGSPLDIPSSAANCVASVHDYESPKHDVTHQSSQQLH